MSIDKVISEMVGYEDRFHFPGELRALNRICDSITDGVIVSIGSYRGQMDCAIALHAHVPIYCIDPRLGWVSESRDFGDVDRPFWMQNILSLGLANRVRPIELPSLVVAKIWDKPITLLWIDGNHVQVAEDLEAWLPHVVDGGLVALHDNNSPHVIEAVAQRDDLVEVERPDLTTVFRKESLYEPHTYENQTLLVRKGPYNHDDKYVLGEIRSYDVGTDPVRNCIDIGGHLGSFTAWIHALWPAAELVAVEPETSGHKLLERNVGEYATVIKGRVAYDPVDVRLEVNYRNSGCHKIVPLSEVVEGQSVVVPPAAVTIEQIMDEHGWDTLSLLKIDCESCELDVLMNMPGETLKKIKKIVGEFHGGHIAFMTGIGQRLQTLGFDVSAETNPAAHSTFLAVNRNWVEPEPVVDIPELFVEDEPIEYGLPITETPKPSKPVTKRKVRR